MPPPNPSTSPHFLTPLKNLLNRPNENDYDQLIYNIRLITAITCAFFNILGGLTSPNYSVSLTLFVLGLQILYLFIQVRYNNSYLLSLISQVNTFIIIAGFGSDAPNVLAIPMMSLVCFVVYSLQFYPVTMNILFVTVCTHIILLQKDHAENLFSYDPIIHTFLKLGGHAWISTAVAISIMMNVFQFFNIKIWKAYAITKQKLVERNLELFEANQKMEEMLQNLKLVNQRLELSNRSLSEALKSQDLFIACVSHELRTPLNAMIGNIELLQIETVDPVKKKMLKTCQICGEILLVMINNILDVAKIHASTLEISVSMMNMSHFIEKIWNVSCQRILQKDLYGKLFISKDVPLWLKGDFHRLIQIIINLIGNATKFTTKGGIRVLISWEKETTVLLETEHESFHSFEDCKEDSGLEKTLETPTEFSHINEVFKMPVAGQQMEKLNQENWMMFSETDDNFTSLQEKLSIPYSRKGTLKIQVIDTGCGIPSEAHSRIFEPFVQADSSITRKYGGTGLGLYIIKELLGKMNGTITVSSEINRGAKFTIRIPLSTISPQEAAHSKESIFSPSQILSKGVTSPVLIVDDSQYNQNILKTYLENMRIQAETADNGLEALNKVKGRPPGYYSMIMMDIQMPVMDGITSCKRIRQYEKESRSAGSIPIIIITANCTSAEQNECMAPNGEIRAAYFFRKPFSYSDCRLSVEAILSQRKAKKSKALVVDDDAFNRELLQTQIKRLGLECETCKNGFEALQKLREDPCIGIILTDFEMPGMNGMEIARRVRNELKMEDIYIIGITGNVEEELNRQSLVSGMNKVLTKPVSLNQISSLLKEYRLI